MTEIPIHQARYHPGAGDVPSQSRSQHRPGRREGHVRAGPRTRHHAARVGRRPRSPMIPDNPASRPSSIRGAILVLERQARYGCHLRQPARRTNLPLDHVQRRRGAGAGGEPGRAGHGDRARCVRADRADDRRCSQRGRHRPVPRHRHARPHPVRGDEDEGHGRAHGQGPHRSTRSPFPADVPGQPVMTATTVVPGANEPSPARA